MALGVPFVPAVVLGGLVYLALPLAGSLAGQAVIVAIGGAIFGALRLVAANDPQVFRVIGVWIMTRFVWHRGTPFGRVVYGPPERERPAGAAR